MARFTLTDDVVKTALRLGAVDGDTMRAARMVEDMVDRSARVTHPQGNRRFGPYVFQVVDGQAVSMDLYDVQIARARRGVYQVGL